MGSDLSIPADGNYTSWEPYLTDQVNHYCSGMSFNVPDRSLGSALFESVSDPGQADKLQQWMTSQVGMMEYIGVKVGPLIVTILAITVLCISCCLSFSINTGMRQWIAKVFHVCKDRPRTRFEDVNPTWKLVSWLVTVIVVIGLFATSVTLMVDSVQVLHADNAAFCDTWLQMRGHFFGVDGYSKGNVKDIAWDWKGTMAQLNELTNISQQVVPSDDNPLKQKIDAAYHDLQTYLNATKDDAEAFTTLNMNRLEGFTDVVETADTMLSPESDTVTRVWLADVARSKSIEYNDVLEQCIADGYASIDEAIAKYLGPNSSLLHASYAMTQDAMRSLKDTNEYIGHLLIRWDELAGLLDGLVKFIIAMAFIVVLLSLGVAGVSVYVVIYKLVLGSYKNDTLPSKRSRQMLAACYVNFMLLGGNSALFAGLQYLVGGIGYDACYMAEVDLFEKGNWNILGQTILNSVDNSSVDIWQILDICLRNDGDGDVANGLGIQGLLTSLETGTTQAQTDIKGLTQRVLNPPDKIIRAELMRVAYHDALLFIFKAEKLFKDDLEGYFNDTHYVRADYLDYQTDPWADWPLLCLAPALDLPVETVAQYCLQDILFPVAPINRALQRINEDISAKVQVTDSSFPLFCSPYNAKNGYSCSCSDANTACIDSGYRKGTSFAQHVDQVNASLGTTLASSFRFAADGIAIHEEFNAMPLQDILAKMGNSTSYAHSLTCDDAGTTDCNYGDFRDYQKQWFIANSDTFITQARALLNHVNDFVANPVLSTMTGLISDAKSSLGHFNCQFVGTALQVGTIPALCTSMMPGVTLLALLFFFHSIICFLAAWGNWRHYHYVVDLASEWVHTSENDYAAGSKMVSKGQQSLLSDDGVREAYTGKKGTMTPRTSARDSFSEKGSLVERMAVEENYKNN